MMDIYFGRPGNLVKLFDPTGGILATLPVGSSVFVNGDGGANVNKALNAARQYTLDYGALGRRNFEYLNAFQLGHMGVGPFVLLDPGRRNLLMANQSSSTSQRNDAEGFTQNDANGLLSSSIVVSGSMPRSLAWAFVSAPALTTPLLTLDKPSSLWPGIPVLPNRHYTFSASVITTGDAAITGQLTINWLDGAGALISSAGSNVTFTTSSQRIFTTAVSPANAQFAVVLVTVTGSTVSAGAVMYFTALQFEHGQLSDWQPGTGIFPVQVVSLPEKYGYAEPDMLVSPSLVLQELR